MLYTAFIMRQNNDRAIAPRKARMLRYVPHKIRTGNYFS
jgi:hypothetical protein